MFFARILSFPDRGRYAEDLAMRMILEDEEVDALAEMTHAEAYKVYIKVRRIMDFRTGIVGGPRRRIYWGEIADWLAVPADRGRKGTPASISHARRVVGLLEAAGLVERRSGDQWLMLHLPLAYSDASHKRRMAQDADYRRSVSRSIADAQCDGTVVIMDRLVANGCPISMEYQESGAPVMTAASDSREYSAAGPDVREVPAAPMAGHAENRPEDFRQTCDREELDEKQYVASSVPATSDNISENPFTPTHKKKPIETNNARAREGSGFSVASPLATGGALPDAGMARNAERPRRIGSAVRQALNRPQPQPFAPAAPLPKPAPSGTSVSGHETVNGVDIFDLDGAPPDWPYIHTHKIPKAAAFEHPDNPVERLWPDKQAVLGSISKLGGGQSLSFPLKRIREDAVWVKEIRAGYLACNLGIPIPEFQDDPGWEAAFVAELANHAGALECWAHWWPREAIDAGIFPPEEMTR